MGTSHAPASSTSTRTGITVLAVVLLAGGLLEHLLSARAIGGSFIAFRDHVFGFVLISVVFGAVIFALGHRFWRGRTDISLLLLGGVNFLLGLFVYLQRFHLHG